MTLPAPIVVGGHVALDFLNTIASPQDEPIEYLSNGAAFVRWLVASGVIDGREAGALLRRFSAADLDAAARRAVALREWLRPIVRRSVTRRVVNLAPAELEHLNAVLGRAFRFLRISRNRRGYTASSQLRWESADSLLVPIGEAIADLFSNQSLALVRLCTSPSCTLWFLDRTKAHRRQWCSMALCGNRAKVAAHRRRKRIP